MRSLSRSALAALAAALALASCTFAPQPTPVPTQAGLPNPASVFCEGQGGRLEIREDAASNQAGRLASKSSLDP